MERTFYQKMVYGMYKDDQGYPILLSPGQNFLFESIYRKSSPRNHVMCFTRFGKSLTVALAVLTSAVAEPEKWAIVAGDMKHAQIIMDYIISHIFDNDYTRSRFIPDKGETEESIRRHRNKQRLTFATDRTKDGKTLLSEIFIGSAKDALGFGAPNVIEDESALIPDNEHSLVMRMLGDDPNKNFLVKIGNPFTRGHFLRSFKDETYRKIIINCYQGIEENRISQQTIDEMRKEAYFKILYECKFPNPYEIDEEGFMSLLTEKELELAQERKVEVAGFGRIGLDVAKGGRNFNVAVLRRSNFARILFKDSEPNSVRIADKLIVFMKSEGVLDRDVYIDDTGIGHGVVSVMQDKGHRVNAVNVGESCVTQAGKDKYDNIRAEMYAGEDGVATWIRQVGVLESSAEWKELLRVRYRKNPRTGKTQIEGKDKMIKRGDESPDVADAIALTFVKVSSYSRNKPINNNPLFIHKTLEETEIASPWGGVRRFPDMPG